MIMRNRLWNKKQYKLFSCYLLLLLTLNLVSQKLSAASCPAPYEERNGMVVIEAENLTVPAGWQRKTVASGYTGSGYIEWVNSANNSRPGIGLIETTISITKTGKYFFKWRSKVGKGTSATEHNDTWLRFPNASNFYAEGRRIVYPYGSGKTPNPNGAGSEGWFKVFSSGTTNWTWSTNTSDNENLQIVVEFNTPGVYKLQISARADAHLLDRMVIYHSSVTSSTAQDLTIAETKCVGETINRQPVVSNPLVDKTATVGASFSYSFPTNTFSDPDGDALTYTAQLSNGSSLPSWLSFNAATRTFSGVPPATTSPSITVTARDGKGGQATDTYVLTVGSTSTNQQSVISFSLINADTEQEIKILSAGEQLNLASLPTKNINIRANTSPNPVGSVKFILSGTQGRTQTETGAPYALFGDNSANYNPWTPYVGNYTLTATPYTGSGASGTAGNSLTINFSVVNNTSSNTAVKYRINAGGANFTTSDGKSFSADAYASGGNAFRQTNTSDIANTANDEIYRTERYGNFTYSLPLTNGDYTVILHFTEVYHNNSGLRKFNVDVEGQRKLTEYDIFAKAGGSFKAVQETLTVKVSDGALNIAFIKGSADNAKVSAIEVIAAATTSAARMATIMPAVETNKTTILTYPNPAISNLTVEGVNSDCADFSISITNGTSVYFPSFVKSTSNRIQIRLDRFGAGMYFLKIRQCGNTYTKKVIINH